MANKKTKRVPDAVREQRQREVTALVAETVQRQYRHIGKTIAEARALFKMSRKTLSCLAGISEGTLKNLERGSQKHSCSWDTIGRLLSVLNLPLLPFDTISLNGNIRQRFFLNDYNPSLQLQSAMTSMLSASPRLEYSLLRSTNQSIDAYQAANSSIDYGAWQVSSLKSINRIAANIPQSLFCHKIEIISLTMGHGWGEAELINDLLLIDEHLHISVRLVCDNNYLLSIGERIIIGRIPDNLRHRVRLISVVGEYSSFIETILQYERCPWTRIICLFGTLMNIDNGEELLSNLCRTMSKDDLLLFDINLAADLARIFDDDARLCEGKLPRGFIVAVENSLQAALLALETRSHDVESIQWYYSEKDIYGITSRSLQSYSVHANAVIHRADMPPRTVSAMRIHRHNPNHMIRVLGGYGMRFIGNAQWGEDLDMIYHGLTLLFIKS